MQDPHGFHPSEALGKTQFPRRTPREPRLLIEWPSPRRVFFENLVDLLLMHQPKKPWLTSRPAAFWPDVFVDRRVPWRRIAHSWILHALAVALVYVITINWPQRPVVKQLNNGTTIAYYSPSEYLPEIDTGKPAEPKPRRGEPALAKQHIRSMPPAPDNYRQTIVTPDPMKIPDDVPLPNLAVNTTIPAPPEAMVLQPNTPLRMAQVTPVGPPPAVNSLRSPVFAPPVPEVVGPPVDPSQVRAKVNLPNVPGPEVVGPPPSLDAAMDRTRLNVPAPSVVGPAVGGDVKRPLGAINMAHEDLAVAAPKLPVTPQQAVMTIRSGASGSGRARPVGTLPAPPSVTAVAAGAPGMKNAGQLLALSVHPVMPNGPIIVPKGSRTGEFETSPEGKPDAPATPNIPAGAGNAAAGDGHGSSTAPPGISVSPGPSTATSGPVVASAGPAVPIAKPPLKMLPTIRPFSAADIARTTRAIPPAESTQKPDEVFGSKKYYSMTLNMPSVTSAGGSCIIRFAELNEQRTSGELTAPVAMLKVDPAYPPEEIRDHVEGTVTLYAVIHKDGTVGQVRVLHGIDATLDNNARIALLHWQFRPATRNGSAVDLEAVVQIPFVAKRKTF